MQYTFCLFWYLVTTRISQEWVSVYLVLFSTCSIVLAVMVTSRFRFCVVYGDVFIELVCVWLLSVEFGQTSTTSSPLSCLSLSECQCPYVSLTLKRGVFPLLCWLFLLPFLFFKKTFLISPHSLLQKCPSWKVPSQPTTLLIYDAEQQRKSK